MALSTRKVVKNIIGVLLLPATIICLLAFVSLLVRIRWHTYPDILFIGGFALYGLLFVINKKESFGYILGHELVHALVSMLFGGRLISIFVSHRNGSVRTTKENFIVSLAPYCVPFYAFVLTIAYFALSLLINTKPYVPLGIFLLGFAIAHHFLFTLRYIKMGQGDIGAHGIVFSISIVALTNVVMLVILMGLFFPAMELRLFWRTILDAVNSVY